MLGPFEIRAEDDQKIFKAVDCVHSVSPDKDGCVHCSLFPVINDCFADAERKVVVRLPLCQESHLLPIDGLIVLCNQECNQFELYLAEQSCVNRECSTVLNTTLQGAHFPSQRGRGVHA